MITGNQNPVVGKEEYYQVNSLGLPLFSNNERYVWKIYKKQKSGSWRDITMNPPKTGQRVPFQFGESVAGTEFRLEAWRETRNLLSNEWSRQKAGEMVVIPAQSKTAKITRVVLFNRGARDVNKANYSDTLIAQAHCVAMFNHTVQFQLWEDDAPGSGHNAEINKNNTTRDIFEGRVNARGIAEVRIPLSSNPALLQRIANRYLMRGDQDEGAHHEYYVTASSAGKIGGSSQTNVNVTNPGYKPKPREDSPKFPATSTSTAPEKPDSESKILDAYFVNGKNQKLTKAAVGNHVQVQIITRNMLGKHVQYKVWEYDAGKNDLVYESGRIEVKGDIINTSGFTLSKEIFDKGIDFGRFDPDSSSQNYFIEVLPLDVSAESQRFGVTPEALMTVETGKSAAVVREEPTGSSTDCKGKYCIKKGDKSELIREINIRLAGFGGNVPTDEFTDRTEKMIKQFQRDYMKVPETGKICGNVLRAIDEFCNKWSEKIIDYKCLCHASDSNVKQANRCSGYGKGLPNEHPGVHRTLLWGVSALKFYLNSQSLYKYRKTSAGYRCWAHNNSIPRTSTNHMGKAIDIQFSEGTYEIAGKLERNLQPLRNIRDKFYIKYLKAEEGWTIPSQNNHYRLEPIGIGRDQSYSWIHMDVALFEPQYLADSFFVKNQDSIIKKSIISLAQELGYANTCNCSRYLKTNVDDNLYQCLTCTSLEKRRIDFYSQVGIPAINFVDSLKSSNKFKGLYMIAQRRQENGFNLNTPGNNPMNIKGSGDAGQTALNTHEYINGQKVNMKDNFANFTTMEKGFEGYIGLLERNFNNAYLSLINDSKTIDDFLTGLQDEGRLGSYATDPNYKSSVKTIFKGVVKDFMKWYDCKSKCSSYNPEQKKQISEDIKLLNILK